MIEAVQIAVNNNAPVASSAILLYSTGVAEGLTLGQLAIAVCVRHAAVLEAQSVVKMNQMTSSANMLETASGYMEGVAAGTAVWAEAKSFLVGTLGLDASTLPDDIDTYAKRMDAVDKIKGRLDLLSQSQQQDMIDLQSIISKRDVAFSASTNLVRSLGNSMGANASNF